MTDFLATQKKLEDLTLNVVHLSNLDVLKQIQFPLKRLTLTVNLFKIEKDLLQFMNKFVTTLEELDLEERFPESLYDMILSKCHKLKTLAVTHLPTSNSFYHNLQPNSSVRNLVIKFHRNRDSFWCFPNFISKLPSIESLVINSIEIPMFQGADIPSLKSITIASIMSYGSDWRAMIRGFPNIENFKSSTALNDETFGATTEGWTHLRHVKLDEGFEATETKFNHLLSNCEELQTVEVDDEAFYPPTCDKEAICTNFKQNGIVFTIRQRKQRCKFFCCDHFWQGSGDLCNNAKQPIRNIRVSSDS